MTMQPLISVIVPVYKAEKLFEQCVRSIRNQTYQNLEIILVNDGSPDNCGAMCDEFAQQDTRIRVIHKKNGGQSSARNAGLDIATGAYIGFVDADDWIEPDMYTHLYELLTANNAQIAACGAQLDFPDKTFRYFNPDYPSNTQIETFSKVEALRQSIVNQKITNSLCDKLFVKTVFENTRMVVGTVYEDMELIPRCLEKIDLAVYDPTPFYHYNQTDESTTRGQFNASRMAEADVAYARVKLCQERFPELYSDAVCLYIKVCLSVIHLSRGVAECKPRRNELIRKLQADLPAESVNALGRKDQIKLKALRISPLCYDVLMGIVAITKNFRGA